MVLNDFLSFNRVTMQVRSYVTSSFVTDYLENVKVIN